MHKSILIITAGVITLVGAAAASYLFLFQPKVQSSLQPAITPQAQTERITSYLLIRKIEELKEHAVYLQHREEGRRLIELMMGGKDQKTEENEPAKDEKVVE